MMTSVLNLQQQFYSTILATDDVIASLCLVYMCEANANDEERCQQAKRKDISEAPIIEG